MMMGKGWVYLTCSSRQHGAGLAEVAVETGCQQEARRERSGWAGWGTAGTAGSTARLRNCSAEARDCACKGQGASTFESWGCPHPQPAPRLQLFGLNQKGSTSNPRPPPLLPS